VLTCLHTSHINVLALWLVVMANYCGSVTAGLRLSVGHVGVESDVDSRGTSKWCNIRYCRSTKAREHLHNRC